MAINTLITIKDALDSFVSDHEQLKRIEWEADDHRAPVITSGDEFPMLFAAPIDVTIGRAMNTHTIRIYVYERINDSRDDVIENANDTSLILRDIRVWWNEYGTDDILILDDPLGTFVSDRELDNLVGYYADFTFEIPSHGRCQVPIDVTPSPSPTCADATYTITDDAGNTLYSGSITSGGSLTQAITDSTAVLKDTAGSTISTTSINAQASADITAPDGNITLNSVAMSTVESGGTENILVLQSNDMTQVGSKQGTHWRIDDSNVSNSDGSYDVNVRAEGSLVLPDSQINVNSVDQGDVVSVKTIDVNITDGVDPVTPDSVSLVGNTLTVTVPAGSATPVGATLMKTGQTTSYRTGDDGDLESGRATDFFTLAVNNPFGNTNRFTDELGGSTYANNIVIDWSTYDNVAGTVLGWYRVLSSVAEVWNDCIDNALALSVGTFTTGWRLCNYIELTSIMNYGLVGVVNYSPFNISGAIFIATSTSVSNATTLYIRKGSVNGVDSAISKTTASNWLAVRTFTVTGTTLS